MKHFVAIVMAILYTMCSFCAYAENEEEGFLDSAGQFLGDVSDGAGELWNGAFESVGDFFGNAGDAIGNAWSELSGATVEAWNKAGVFIGEKSEEISVWMSISGNDALEKLKTAYDELAAEAQLSSAAANALWLQVMDYADTNGIAKVTQAKLTVAAMTYALADEELGAADQVVANMLLNGEITDQPAAEAALAVMLAGVQGVPSAPDPNEPRYYMGEVVNTGKDNGYSEAHKLESDDPHFGWTLGSFFVSGYTSVYEDANGNPVFIKTLGDQIELWFQLEQDIDCLNGKDYLSITEDSNGFDEAFGIGKTNFGRGALVTQHTDYRNAVGTPQLYTDYLSGITASGADTTVQLFEEGDYKVALNYEIKDDSFKLLKSYTDYRIEFEFSVRNGNCMVYPFDVLTGAELTNTAVTENGFYLDLAKSRYLDINIKREVLSEGATGLTEDVRFNRPAREGDQYTDEGIYTITVSNRYTGQQTTKQIYVGTNKLLLAHIVTGLSIQEIRDQIAKGAQIAEDGTIIGIVN